MDSACGAVTVTDITTAQYSSILSVSTVAVKAEMISGFTSSSTLEVNLTTDITIGVSHIWPTPEDIQFLYTIAGNASIRAGADVVEDQPLSGFNAILIRLDDSAPGNFATEFKTITFNGVSIRNFFASDGSDSVLITDFGSTIDLRGAFYKNPASAGNESRLTFTAVNIPEPSSILISALLLSVFVIRRKQ